MDLTESRALLGFLALAWKLRQMGDQAQTVSKSAVNEPNCLAHFDKNNPIF